jgi:hypothetical protein
LGCPISCVICWGGGGGRGGPTDYFVTPNLCRG